MMRFFTSRDLSESLQIPLSRWKRWAREFLPPDPLGGRQSGFARQYNFNQAFQVYLGGYLVGQLKFTVPEVVQILEDIREWMHAQGFYMDFSNTDPKRRRSAPEVKTYLLYILPAEETTKDAFPFGYRIRGVIDGNGPDGQRRDERRCDCFPCQQRAGMDPIRAAGGRIMNISRLREYFVARLEAFNAAPK